MNDNDKKPATFGSLWTGIYWWMFLLVAVLAVPSIAFIVAATVPDRGIGQVAVFILSCWVSTFLGMKLMKK